MMALENKTYPLSDPGIFHTIQGEGALLGVPMVFVRLGGCSINCPECDTNYRIASRMSAVEIGKKVRAIKPKNTEWIWVTGGEPTDYDLWPLLEVIRLEGHVALATSGGGALGAGGRLVEFLSVSPHFQPNRMQLVMGSQINLVPGLGELNLSDWEDYSFHSFRHHYITPGDDSPETLNLCLDWISRHREFKLGVQAHKRWNLL